MDRCKPNGSLPVPFERFSPGRQLSEATYVPCGQVEFTIIGWGHFRHKNPDKKVNTRLMKMVQKVFLNPPPAVHGRIIVVLSLGIRSYSHRAQSSQRPFRYQFSHKYAHASRKSLATQKSYICLTAQWRIPGADGAAYPGMRGCAQKWSSTMSTSCTRRSSGQKMRQLWSSLAFSLAVAVSGSTRAGNLIIHCIWILLRGHLHLNRI